jgi:hypothetical protein
MRGTTRKLILPFRAGREADVEDVQPFTGTSNKLFLLRVFDHLWHCIPWSLR